MPKLMSTAMQKPKTSLTIVLVAAGAAIIGALIKRSRTVDNDDSAQTAAA